MTWAEIIEIHKEIYLIAEKNEKELRTLAVEIEKGNEILRECLRLAKGEFTPNDIIGNKNIYGEKR